MNIGQRALCSLTAVATAFVIALPTPTVQAQDAVKFNMSWLPQGSQSGVIVAIEKGFYEEADLSVEATRGYGGIRTTNEINEGLFEFGYGNPLGVILNQAEGGHTVMIGAINDTWPGGLCFVKERHTVETPADLKGMSVGGGQASPVQAMLPAWLELNGVAAEEVKLLQMDPAVVDASLIEGQIDAAECWLGSNKALLEERASQAGVEIGWIRYSDHQMEIYGSGLVTSEALIKDKPDLVQRFVQATYRGYDYARENPEEATDILLKHFPVLSRDVTLKQVLETNELIEGPGQLGWMEQEKMARTLEFLASAYDLAERVSVDDIYTTQFIQQ
jgi:NitT/TauT family transport system substrate-binding protein